jgi:hypothetical protein
VSQLPACSGRIMRGVSGTRVLGFLLRASILKFLFSLQSAPRRTTVPSLSFSTVDMSYPFSYHFSVLAVDALRAQDASVPRPRKACPQQSEDSLPHARHTHPFRKSPRTLRLPPNPQLSAVACRLSAAVSLESPAVICRLSTVSCRFPPNPQLSAVDCRLSAAVSLRILSCQL